MKVILTTLNSKFIHSNLAIRYLREYIRDINDAEIMEFTINQTRERIVAEIYKSRPDLIGFSTYIWNIEETLRICETIKIINPKTKILLGGPEVSFDGKQIMEEHPYVDYIIYGEGEESFKELLSNEDLEQIQGLIYRDVNGFVLVNEPRKLIEDLNTIPSPFESIGDEFKNKIVYYESSRGCPFNCEFCLSSTIKGVRYFELERVKRDIKILIDGEVSQVKFVDRTFNANKNYSMEIMKYIMELDPIDINFHFEVTAHLIDDEMLEFLKQPKEGLFQFEIGVQSTNDDTIDAIGRVTDFNKLKRITKKIKAYRNIHQHLDLIAGLPYEDYASFRNSFNDVYSIRPEKLQLGFLKLLKGSGLRMNEDKYGYKYINSPPYEVLESSYLGYEDVIKIKGIEDLVEKYYNEGYFSNSIEFIIANFYDYSFDFYENFSRYWDSHQLSEVAHSRNSLYQILLDYYIYNDYENKLEFIELLKFDYILNNRKITLPLGVERSHNNIKQIELHQLLKNEEFKIKYLNEDKDLPTKKVINKVLIEGFSIDVFMLINNGYIPLGDKTQVFILFYYKDNVINRCIASDVTDYVNKIRSI